MGATKGYIEQRLSFIFRAYAHVFPLSVNTGLCGAIVAVATDSRHIRAITWPVGHISARSLDVYPCKIK